MRTLILIFLELGEMRVIRNELHLYEIVNFDFDLISLSDKKYLCYWINIGASLLLLVAVIKKIKYLSIVYAITQCIWLASLVSALVFNLYLKNGVSGLHFVITAICTSCAINTFFYEFTYY
uniref:CSON006569 protein n=1 Tax=Culicoides sonorensis TaxID=179676 RepID=A0A336MXW0_CULSO